MMKEKQGCEPLVYIISGKTTLAFLILLILSFPDFNQGGIAWIGSIPIHFCLL